MDFFEIKKSLRRIGDKKYIVGQEPEDPLVLIDGKRLETVKLNSYILESTSGFFDVLTNTRTISDDIVSNTLSVKTGNYTELSGLKIFFDSGEARHINTDTIDFISGNSESIHISGVNVLKFIQELSGNLNQTGAFLDSKIESLSGTLNQTGILLDSKIESLSGTLNQTGILLDSKIESLSGTLNQTGILLDSKIESLSGTLNQTGILLDSKIESLSGNLNETGAFLDSKIESLSGTLNQTGDLLSSEIKSLSGDLSETKNFLDSKIESLSGSFTTGVFLDSKIESLSGNLNQTGALLDSKIESVERQVSRLDDTSFEITGSLNRYELQEAFEINEDGDVMPNDHVFISDTMWILKSENDLELRSNIWRYNTGPEAFTDDISF